MLLTADGDVQLGQKLLGPGGTTTHLAQASGAAAPPENPRLVRAVSEPGSTATSVLHESWFQSFVMQTIKGLEESFRQGAERVIIAGIKGDLQLGKYTLAEWPELLSKIQEAVESGRVKGASWERIEERRIDIVHLEETTALASGTTHVVVASCPGVHMDVVDTVCGTNANVHLSFARSGDANELFAQEQHPTEKPAEGAAS